MLVTLKEEQIQDYMYRREKETTIFRKKSFDKILRSTFLGHFVAAYSYVGAHPRSKMSFLRMCILCTIIRCWESPHTLFSHLPLHLLLLFNSSSLMALLRLHLFHCSIHFSFRCHLSHQVADLTDHLTGEAYPTPNRSVDDEECSIYSACSLCAANNCADSSERRLEWHSAGSEGQVVALTWRPNSACHTRCCHY